MSFIRYTDGAEIVASVWLGLLIAAVIFHLFGAF